MKDKVKITDSLYLNGRNSDLIAKKEPVEIEGYFTCVARERGKLVPGSRRAGKNIWTLAGREYLASLMSYAAYGIGGGQDTPARNDRIRYFGFGSGTTPEVSTVNKLVAPVAFDATNTQFLTQIAIPTFPFQIGSDFGASVQYVREYAETEISVSGDVTISEAGLYTDGSSLSSFTPLTRSILLIDASSQAPAAYKAFEALKKTQNFVLQVTWQISF